MKNTWHIVTNEWCIGKDLLARIPLKAVKLSHEFPGHSALQGGASLCYVWLARSHTLENLLVACKDGWSAPAANNQGYRYMMYYTMHKFDSRVVGERSNKPPMYTYTCIYVL